jgi:hypothetical protein
VDPTAFTAKESNSGFWLLLREKKSSANQALCTKAPIVDENE